MKYKAVLFDFDCTLADATQGIIACFIHTFSEAGYAPVSKDKILRTIGLSMDDAFRELLQQDLTHELTALKNIYRAKADEIMTKNTILYDGSAEILHALKRSKVRTGIVSTKNRYRIMETLVREQLTAAVDVIIGGEDVKTHKPSPEGLLAAAAKLNLNPIEILYIGDHTVDAIAAKEAGMDFAAVTTGTVSEKDFIPFSPIAAASDLVNCLTKLELLDCENSAAAAVFAPQS